MYRQKFEEEKKLLGKILGKRYKLVQIIGKATYSTVYKCVCLESQEKLALKIADYKDENDFIRRERKFYKKAKRMDGFAKFYKDGYFQMRRFIILEKLSDSLDKKKFSIKTILNIGVSGIKLLEKVHKLGFVHRDIRPENFFLGHKQKKDKIYLTGFGLIHPFPNQLHEEKNDKAMIGTPRFASIAAHQGKQQGRKDDLLSFGYMLIYLMKQKLPWQGLDDSLTLKQRLDQIHQIKVNVQYPQLCNYKSETFGIQYNGEVLIKYFNYLNALSIIDEPNYDWLKKIFREEVDKIVRNNINVNNLKWSCSQKFDWLMGLENLNTARNILAPLND